MSQYIQWMNRKKESNLLEATEIWSPSTTDESELISFLDR